MVFASGGFEADISTAMFRDGAAFATNGEPFVSVVRADDVETLLV